MEHPAFVAHLRSQGGDPHPRRGLGLLVLCVAMFISAVDTTIVNVALPDISSDLGGREVDDRLGGLPPEARDRAGQSIEDAQQVIAGSGGGLRDQLVVRADDAFDVAARAGFGLSIGLLPEGA